jgi:hypothetical protein
MGSSHPGLHRETISKKKKDFFFFVELEFELRISHLQSRHCTTRANTSSSFSSGYFGEAWAGLDPQSSQVARITGMSHQTPR